jgi:stress-induced-phosphoprotein 1
MGSFQKIKKFFSKKMTSETLKAQGNAAFSSGDYENAILFFSQAIEQAPDNHVLFSNR